MHVNNGHVCYSDHPVYLCKDNTLLSKIITISVQIVQLYRWINNLNTQQLVHLVYRKIWYLGVRYSDKPVILLSGIQIPTLSYLLKFSFSSIYQRQILHVNVYLNCHFSPVKLPPNFTGKIMRAQLLSSKLRRITRPGIVIQK